MNDDTPVYPTIRMKLSGMNPPALLAVACLSTALKGSGVEREEINRIVDEALADAG